VRVLGCPRTRRVAQAGLPHHSGACAPKMGRSPQTFSYADCMSEHDCQGSSCRCMNRGGYWPKKQRPRKQPSAGPVTVKKPDGTVEQRPAYSMAKLKEIVGHENTADERKLSEFVPRQATVEPE
jgi:hypothetical protein